MKKLNTKSLKIVKMVKCVLVKVSQSQLYEPKSRPNDLKRHVAYITSNPSHLVFRRSATTTSNTKQYPVCLSLSLFQPLLQNNTPALQFRHRERIAGFQRTNRFQRTNSGIKIPNSGILNVFDEVMRCQFDDNFLYLTIFTII